MRKIQEYAKFIAAILTAAVNAGVLTLLPEKYALYVAIAVSVVGAIVVHQVPNAPQSDDPEDLLPAEAEQVKASDSGHNDQGVPL